MNVFLNAIDAIPRWLSVSPESGAIDGVASANVDALFNASHLMGGDYDLNIVFTSNDPDEPQITVPAQLHVTGAPDITSSRDTIQYDSLFIGASGSESFQISNIGTDTLMISNITIDQSDFALDTALTSYILPPYQNLDLSVTFSPTTDSYIIGNLSILSNDPDSSTYSILLTGKGLIPPDISVAPDTLSESLLTGEISTQTLTISNTGGSDLHYDIGRNVSASVIQKLQDLADQANEGIQHVSQTSQNGETTVTLDDPGRFEAQVKAYTNYAEAVEGLPSIAVIGEFSSAMLSSLLLSTRLTAQYLFFDAGNDYSYSTIQSYDGAIISEYDYGITPTEATALQSFYQTGKGIVCGMDDFDDLSTSVQSVIFPIFGISSAIDYDFSFGSLNPSNPITQGVSTLTPYPNDNDYFILNTADWIYEDPSHRIFGASNEGLANTVIMGEYLNYIWSSSSNNQHLIENAIEWAMQGGWLSASPESGTIGAGSNEQITVTFDATGMNGGNYDGQIVISSNDPDESETNVGVHLHVTGAPDITVTPDTINFGQTFVGFSKTSDTLTIINDGTDILNISNITSGLTEFTFDSTNFNLDPGDSRQVQITFSPAATGAVSSTVTISSNDHDEPSVTIVLKGEGLISPDISVSPDSLSESILTGETSTQTLTISNTGGSNLFLTVNNEILTSTQLYCSLVDNSGSGERIQSENDVIFYPPFSKKVYSTIENQPAVFNNILVLEAVTSSMNYHIALDNLGLPHTLVTNWTLLESELNNGTDWEFIIINSYVSTPNINTIDSLNIFQNQGGYLIYADWYVSGYPAHLLMTNMGVSYQNNISTPINFAAIDTSDILFNSPNSIYTLNWTHNQANVDGQIAQAINGATSKAVYYGYPTSGTIIINNNKNCIFNAFQAENFNSDHDGDGKVDIVELIENEINLLVMDNWLSISPISGTISPGSNLILNVTFNAENMYGGDYYANINIFSNDPDESPFTVPTHLHVTGVPDISASKDTLQYGAVFVHGTAYDTLIITNDGTDILTVSDIVSNESDFTPDSTNFSLNPGETQQVIVRFSPPQVGPIVGILTITSNDHDESSIQVSLQGTGVAPPEIAISPDSLSADLVVNEKSTQLLTISNQGGSDLDFAMTIEEVGGAGLLSAKKTYHYYNLPSHNVTIDSDGEQALSSPIQKKINNIDLFAVDLTGIKIGYDSYHCTYFSNDTVLVWDLIARGAIVYQITSTVTSGLLSTFDIIWLDDNNGNSFSTQEINDIETWVQNGGNVFIQSDQPGSAASLYSRFGITFTGGSGVSGPTTNIFSHPTTDGIGQVHLPGPVSQLTYSSPVVPIVNDAGNNKHACAVEIGNGRVVCICDEVVMNGPISYDDNRAYGNKIFDWLAAGSSTGWITLLPETGIVPPSASFYITALFDATGLDAGGYDANIIIQNNDPIHSSVTIPAHLDVISGLSVSFSQGWNFISWNVDTPNDATDVVLNEIIGEINIALGFEQGGSAYDPSLPSAINTLNQMDHFHGYEIYSNSDTTIFIPGNTIDPQTSIYLEENWNLVSYLPSFPDSTSHAMESIIDRTVVVLGYDGGGLTYDPSVPPLVNTLKVMNPGYGYWIKTSTADTLIYPNSTIIQSTGLAKTIVRVNGVVNESEVVPTKEWISVWGQNIEIDNHLISVGTIVKAVDAQGTVCGSCIVQHKGVFGMMPIYRDDPQTEIDEGALPGEEITLYIDEFKVSDPLIWTHFGDVINFEQIVTALGGELRSLPDQFMLYQNHPNPFNPVTTIKYDLPKPSDVEIRIFNVLGAEVTRLTDIPKEAGFHSIQWNTQTNDGIQVPSGIYIYTISSNEFKMTRKMIVLR